MKNELSIRQARRIALAAQGFAKPRPKGRVDRRHLRSTMDRIQLLQLDSIPVVIRTQYMPLFSRLGSYRAELLDEIAYDADEWFESWSHEASLLPVAMEPWLRWSKQRSREGETWAWLHRMAKKDPGYVEAVLDEVKARGPLAANELEDQRRQCGHPWGNRSEGAVALDWLFRIGALGIRRTHRFGKKFDLLERIVPAEIRAQATPSFESALDELLDRSARAHGIATADSLVDYFRLPVRPAKARLESLVENGRVEKIQVEGWKKPAYRHPDAKLPREIKAAALLSPFDPVVWNRKRIAALFNFNYRIEIYTPAKKRKYGYYVLPFLMGELLVARFDLKTDRESRTLRVLASYAEEGVDFGKVASAAANELATLSKFLGVDQIKVGQRGNLARALRIEIHALG